MSDPTHGTPPYTVFVETTPQPGTYLLYAAAVAEGQRLVTETGKPVEVRDSKGDTVWRG